MIVSKLDSAYIFIFIRNAHVTFSNVDRKPFCSLRPENLFLRMDDERTQCICGFTHHTRLMICCDECNVWLHAECYGLDQKRVKEIEKKNLDFFCNGVN